jgi:hypothetical protein
MQPAHPKPFIWTATTEEILAGVSIVQTNIKRLVGTQSNDGRMTRH